MRAAFFFFFLFNASPCEQVAKLSAGGALLAVPHSAGAFLGSCPKLPHGNLRDLGPLNASISFCVAARRCYSACCKPFSAHSLRRRRQRPFRSLERRLKRPRPLSEKRHIHLGAAPPNTPLFHDQGTKNSHFRGVQLLKLRSPPHLSQLRKFYRAFFLSFFHLWHAKAARVCIAQTFQSEAKPQ